MNIKELENAIIQRIEGAGVPFRKVVPLAGPIKEVLSNMRLWPAAIVGYAGGKDYPQTSELYKGERDFNIFVVDKNLRDTAEAKVDVYELVDSIRQLFAGVTTELGVDGVDIVHPVVDEPVVLEDNKVVWNVKIRITGFWKKGG